MRAVECPCGEHIEARTDEQLLTDMRRHADEDHPQQYSEAELKRILAAGAHDQAA